MARSSFRQQVARQRMLHLGGIGFLTLVCVLLIGIEGLRSLSSRAEMIKEARFETANLSHALAQHVHDTVVGVDHLVRELRDRLELEGNTPALEAWLQRLGDHPLAEARALRNIAAIGVNGSVLASSRRGLSSELTFGDRPYFVFHQINPARNLHISGPLHSRFDESRVLIVSRRLDAPDGSFAGVIAATLSIASFQTFFASFDSNFRGNISLVTRDGAILAHTPESSVSVDANIANGEIFTNRLPVEPQGTLEFAYSPEGSRRIGSYRLVEQLPLVMIVARKVDDVLTPWRAQTMQRMGLMAIITVCVALLGILLTRQSMRLLSAESQYRLLAENSGDAIACVDRDGNCRYASPAFTTMTGWMTGAILHQPWRHVIHPDDRAALERSMEEAWRNPGGVTSTFRLHRFCGTHVWSEARMQVGRDQEHPYLVINLRDITRRKALEEQLKRANRELQILASQDPLTGLANRRHLDKVLHVEWQRAVREGTSLSLILVDVDLFKAFNDRYGHLAGDNCLVQVAGILTSGLRRPGDLVARYGGEEMALLLPRTDRQGASETAERLRAALEDAHIPHEANIGGGGILTASFGVASVRPLTLPDLKQSIPAVIAAADRALYMAKAHGRNRVHAADEDIPLAS